MNPRIYLSPPHVGAAELAHVQEAFATNWVAPVGPHLDAFEAEFAAYVGAQHAVGLASGTAALHLALRDLGVGPGDEVLVSTFTFAASVNPVLYEGATPVFADSERASWNVDPNLVEDVFRSRARRGRQVRAFIPVHLYGQTADMGALAALCLRYGVPMVEDAAEALGARHGVRHPGTFGRAGIYSFNGNKIITTSGGGMLVTDDARVAAHVRKLATQAREPVAHYEHTEIGFNYRLSNVLAGIGRGQLAQIEDRVAARRRVFARYEAALGDLPGLAFMPEASWGRHTRWLSCVVIDPAAFGADREAVRRALEAENIEARPLWKPMHLQPAYSGYEAVGGGVSEALFADGLCLPSGSALSEAEQDRVVATVRAVHECAVHGGAVHGGAVHGGAVHGGAVHGGAVYGGAVHGCAAAGLAAGTSLYSHAA
ncbi:MAG: DegT/DnrJ/EryC1/StrS family aminotransferase [Rubricoccaceae bacterium]